MVKTAIAKTPSDVVFYVTQAEVVRLQWKNLCFFMPETPIEPFLATLDTRSNATFNYWRDPTSSGKFFQKTKCNTLDVTLFHHFFGFQDILVMHAVYSLGYISVIKFITSTNTSILVVGYSSSSGSSGLLTS